MKQVILLHKFGLLFCMAELKEATVALQNLVNFMHTHVNTNLIQRTNNFRQKKSGNLKTLWRVLLPFILNTFTT